MSAYRGMLSLGAAENLWEVTWSGFAYPARREFLPLLENEAGTSGNVVIQEGSIPRRLGKLGFTAVGDQREIVRDYDEGSEEVTFTDQDGATCLVLPDKLSSSWMFADLWHVDVDLVQLSEPVPAFTPGSGS